MKTPEWIRSPIKLAAGITKYKQDTIGIEIEVEGRNLPKAIFQTWILHDDGSLRGEDSCEYVLREPLTRRGVFEALTYLEEKFKESGAVLDTESDRTSVHVHLNVQGKSWTEIFTFWTLWTIIEDLSFELCGDERRGNLFCMRVKDCEGSILGAKDRFEAMDYPFRNNEYRYAACNLQSVNKFGSIEFRGMHGTVDKKEILAWVDFLVLCLKASEKFDNPHQVINRFSQVGPHEFITRILELPDLMSRKLLDHPDFRQMMWEGMRLAQDIAWILPDWGKKEDKPVEGPKKKTKLDMAIELVQEAPRPGRFDGLQADIQRREHDWIRLRQEQLRQEAENPPVVAVPEDRPRGFRIAPGQWREFVNQQAAPAAPFLDPLAAPQPIEAPPAPNLGNWGLVDEIQAGPAEQQPRPRRRPRQRRRRILGE